MHYKAKLNLVIGGWYKTKEGVVYKIVKCPHDGCSGGGCNSLLMQCIYSPRKIRNITLCGDGSIRGELIYYCSDEEIAYFSL